MPSVRLVVGLGNPGPRYARTRHNAGQVVVERLAERRGAPPFKDRYAGRYSEGRGPSGPLSFLVPTTFMNLSGDSVGPAAGSLRLERPQVLVIHDEIDLPFGVVRGKVGGGAGGHNGLKSVTRGLGGGDYLRIRIGVGRPPSDFRGDEADWVLMAFTEPAVAVDALLGRALQMAEVAIDEGMDAAIARFHAAEPGSRAARRETAADGVPDDESGSPRTDPAG